MRTPVNVPAEFSSLVNVGSTTPSVFSFTERKEYSPQLAGGVELAITQNVKTQRQFTFFFRININSLTVSDQLMEIDGGDIAINLDLSALPDKKFVWNAIGLETIESRAFQDANQGVWMRFAIVSDSFLSQIRMYEDVLTDLVEAIGVSQYSFFHDGKIKFHLANPNDAIVSDVRLFSSALSLQEVDDLIPT